MSQFTIPESTPFGAEPDAPPRTSGLAVTSFICSLVFCCPLVSVLGPILGLISLIQIRANAMLRGTGWAVAGIVLGSVVTLSCLAFTFVPPLTLALLEQIWPIQRLPSETLAAGSRGDSTTFRASFHGDGATVPDEVVEAFLTAMDARYGTFQSLEIDPSGGTSPQMGDTEIDMTYLAQFSGGAVPVEVVWVLADPQTGALVMKLASIRLIDPNGDLVYPPMPDVHPGEVPMPDMPPMPEALPVPEPAPSADEPGS